MNLEFIIPVSITLGLWWMIAHIVSVVADSRRRRESVKTFTEFYSRMFERFGSGGELTQFLQTEGGRDFLASMSLDRTAASPKDRILRATQTGLVLACLGAGFLLAGPLFVTDPDGRSAMGVIGLVGFAGGVGYLLSSRAALKLSSRWGMFDEPTPGRLSGGSQIG
jgi:hypothetical protein